MSKIIKGLVVVLALGGLAYGGYFFWSGQNGGDISDQPQANVTDESVWGLIEVASPTPGDTITSPLIITGQARGNWFWEATFPIVLTNWDGLIIAQWYAEAQLDPNDPESTWMTTEFVPFRAELEFENPSQEADPEGEQVPDGVNFSKNGYLILQKSNASGLPEHDAAMEIPIRFE